MKTKIEADITFARGDGQRGNGGDFLVIAGAMSNDRGLATWTPASAKDRSHKNAAFVEEDDMSSQPTGFFLARGHSVLIHWAMSDSSRSTATLAGRCGLHPMLWRRRQT